VNIWQRFQMPARGRKKAPRCCWLKRIYSAAICRRTFIIKHRIPDAVRIAAIRLCFGEPQANNMRALRLPQKQQAAIGRLVAAGKIDGEFLASDRWQVERKRRIASHSGCAAGLIREATRGNTSCYVNRAPFATAVSEIHMLVPNLG
jgi:hypothetical protein